MNYDFDYYIGQDLRAPGRPGKPRPGSRRGGLHFDSAAQAAQYAQQLAQWEQEFEQYEQQAAAYRDAKHHRMVLFKDQLRDDYQLTHSQFKVLWTAAYDRGHSLGLRAVAEQFDELFDLVMSFNQQSPSRGN